jgi:hypothetical protein
MGRMTPLSESLREIVDINRRADLTLKQCSGQFSRLKGFMSDITIIFGDIVDKFEVRSAKESLSFFRLLDSVLHFDDLSFLSLMAHYTSIVQILRYRLESMIQAVYLDQQHPLFTLSQKLCILEEISDKREYFTTRLLNQISVNNKESIRDLYKQLSIGAHPSQVDFPTIEKMIEYQKNLALSIDCVKLDEIVSLTMQTFDAIFFLILHVSKEAKASIKFRKDIKSVIEKYNLFLLHKLV